MFKSWSCHLGPGPNVAVIEFSSQALVAAAPSLHGGVALGVNGGRLLLLYNPASRGLLWKLKALCGSAKESREVDGSGSKTTSCQLPRLPTLRLTDLEDGFRKTQVSCDIHPPQSLVLTIALVKPVERDDAPHDGVGPHGHPLAAGRGSFLGWF